jgi:phospholipase C
MRETIDYRDETTLPTLYALANEYTVFDRWFASVPGPTFPNRHFINCATAGGETTNRVSILGLPLKCIYDSLIEGKKTWKAYQSGTWSSLALYRSMRRPKNLRRMKKFKKFLHDCREGELPSFSFVDPSFEENEHPPNDMSMGDNYLKTVYQAVRNSPQWNETLLLVTYDESGGFYDHVPPPVGVPRPDDSPLNPPVKHFNFDRLGGRVPTIAISPLVDKGRVISDSPDGRIFEHSSIPATVKKLFDLPNFLSKRDEWAATFDIAITRSQPRSDCLRAENIGTDFSSRISFGR